MIFPYQLSLGVNADNMNDYVAEEVVPAVSGSWIVKKDLVMNED